MNIVIRQGDLESDRELIIDTLFRYQTPHSDDKRFDWLYKGNPHGKAEVWIAIDSDNGTIIGMGSAFPRRVCVGERRELGWVLGDFCINDKYRSLGPALQLQRACLTAIDSGVVSFCYDFPSTSMMAVYKRLRINPIRQMVRYAKPLRMDRKIGEIVKIHSIVRILSAATNLLLSLGEHRAKDSEVLEIVLDREDCGEEFSLLSREVSKLYGVCIERSAEYLNWRYLRNPLYKYEFITARRNSVLMAYAVFSLSGEDATIADLFGVEDGVTIQTLVSRLLSILRKRGVVTVSVPIIDSGSMVTVLQSLGFKAREGTPIVLYCPPNSPGRYSLCQEKKWLLMEGDRDS